jgi:acetyltransferase-like isoleucine patch superfamily enzyme
MSHLIAASANISPLAAIDDRHDVGFIVGEDAIIEAFVKIAFRNKNGALTIGRRSQVRSGVVIDVGEEVAIGEGVIIGANSVLAGVEWRYESSAQTLLEQQREDRELGRIVIEDDVFIGDACVLCQGAVLRRGCVIGPNSLVDGEVEPYSINVGSPARRSGYRV